MQGRRSQFFGKGGEGILIFMGSCTIIARNPCPKHGMLNRGVRGWRPKGGAGSGKEERKKEGGGGQGGVTLFTSGGERTHF